jgi:uridine kinase
MKPHLVAIVGGSGSGKTRLARQVLEVFGSKAGYICLDDFYKDQSLLSPRERAAVNYDHPDAIDWRLLLFCLQMIASGKPAALPTYDFSSHTRRSQPRRWKPKPIVVLDGLWLLRHKVVRQLCHQSVFVDCAESLRLARRLKRDQKERARSAKSIHRQFREQVAPMHNRFVARQAAQADIVLSSPIPDRQLQQMIREIHKSMSKKRPAKY